MDYRITLEADDSAGEVPQAVRAGIRGADPADVPARDWVPICLALRDPQGAILGGLYGATMWSWLMIDGLWVAEELRGKGFGSQLLGESERIAAERGCGGAWLGTFDFQARAFYERHGYTVFGELPGCPPGHTHFHLQKRFDWQPGAPDGAAAGEAG
jgi:GNAT superfamily N-acetyltransferase